MREIKFRGKHLDNGTWILGDLIRIDGHTFIFPDTAPDSFDRYMVDPATVGQFTGLQHNGRTEVYDGDVFRRWLEDSVHPDGGIWAYHVVTWIEDRYLLLEIGFDYKGNYSEEWTLAKELTDPAWKYVGSIPDRSELLKNRTNDND